LSNESIDFVVQEQDKKDASPKKTKKQIMEAKVRRRRQMESDKRNSPNHKKLHKHTKDCKSGLLDHIEIVDDEVIDKNKKKGAQSPRKKASVKAVVIEVEAERARQKEERNQFRKWKRQEAKRIEKEKQREIRKQEIREKNQLLYTL